MKLTKLHISVLLLIASMLLGLILSNQTVKAEVVSWLDSPVTVELLPDKSLDTTTYPFANLQQVCLEQNIQVSNSAQLDKSCIYQAKNFEIGRIYRCIPNYYSCDSQYDVVYRANGSGVFYKLKGFGGAAIFNSCQIVNKNTDNLVSNCGASVIENLPSHLTPAISAQLEPVLQFNSSSVYSIPQTDGSYARFWRAAISSNGKWMVTEADNYAVLRVNLETKELQFITRAAQTGYGRDAYYEMAISNDGQYIAISGLNLAAEVFQVTPSCGITAQEFDRAWVNENSGITNCPSRNFTRLMEESYLQPTSSQPSSFYMFTNTKFNDEGTALTGLYTSRTGATWLTLQLPAGNTEPPTSTPRLKYLALGDSYTSGEGDTDGLSGPHHYRELTNENHPPIEKCHISTRSYPYLLAKDWRLTAEEWNTVACSGALIGEDYLLNDKYIGQKNRLDRYKGNLEALNGFKELGLQLFIPGRNPQLRFIKQYQPETITINGSGNDAGFSAILDACVSPFHSEENCEYASNDDDGYNKKSGLLNNIKSQYDKVKDLVGEIKKASPSSKVFYIGYPQFVARTDKECGGYVSLSKDERVFIRDSVTYLNAVIREAARSAGAEYINIEDALIVGNDNHQLCGNGKSYVNGFNLDCDDSDKVRALAGKDDCAESFHPRPEAHKLIAERINKRIKDTANYCNNACTTHTLDQIPLPGTFYAIKDYKPSPTPQNTGMDLIIQKQNESLKLKVETKNLKAGTQAKAIIKSTPTLIGNYIVNSDGTLSISADVPGSIKPGFHTLHIEAIDENNQLVDRQWLVRVYGPDGDINENGINDVNEACLFMPIKHTDLNNNGVDDGCDVDIMVSEPFKYVELGPEPDSNGISLVGNTATTKIAKTTDYSINTSNAQPTKIGSIAHYNSQIKTQLKDDDLNNKNGLNVIFILMIPLILITLVLLYIHGKSKKDYTK